MHEDYKGHTITVTKGLEFEVAGPFFDGPKRTDTAQKARDAIDLRAKQQESQEREKLSIPLLNDKGEPVTLTGLHGANYNMLGVGKSTAYGMSVYPAVDWVGDLLKERTKLRARVSEITGILDRFSMSAGSRHHRGHAEAIAAVKWEIANKTAEAEKRRPQ